MNRLPRFVFIITVCLLIVFFAGSCSIGSEYDPFLQIVNKSVYTIDQVRIDGEDMLSSGETLEYLDEMDFPVTEGDHSIAVSIPGHPMFDPVDYFSNTFPMGYFYKVKYTDDTKFSTDKWHADYWGLD
jgi:hypothetical protein